MILPGIAVMIATVIALILSYKITEEADLSSIIAIPVFSLIGSFGGYYTVTVLLM